MRQGSVCRRGSRRQGPVSSGSTSRRRCSARGRGARPGSRARRGDSVRATARSTRWSQSRSSSTSAAVDEVLAEVERVTEAGGRAGGHRQERRVVERPQRPGCRTSRSSGSTSGGALDVPGRRPGPRALVLARRIPSTLARPFDDVRVEHLLSPAEATGRLFRRVPIGPAHDALDGPRAGRPA